MRAIHATSRKRMFVWAFAVLTEIVTWSSILISGVLFILKAESVEMIIRSTVAIMVRPLCPSG